MYRVSPVRNHRSKGIKVKHVLQVCLLLAVCFWLIYQVKHSHDKKKEFDDNDANFATKSKSSSELVRLGRKDLQPRIVGLAINNEKHRDEPEEENVQEEEGGGDKPEEEDQEKENKTEDKNDEHKEGGEDEVDDHDEEKSDVEVDQGEDFVDEDKERGEDDENGTEERDSEENDDQVEDENSLEDHDHEDSTSSHEAREENYKADDASSAVTHDTKANTSENEHGILTETAEHAEANALEAEVSVNSSTQINAGQNITGLKVENGEADRKDIRLNTANREENSAVSISSNSADTLVLNSTGTEGFTDNSGLTAHLTETSGESQDFSLQNRTQATSQDRNVTIEDTTSRGFNISTSLQQDSKSADTVKNNLTDSHLPISTKSEDANTTLVDSSNVSGNRVSSMAEKVVQGNRSVGAVDNMELPLKENNATAIEKSYKSNESGTTDEGRDTSNADELAEVKNSPLDTLDSSIHLDEKHVRADLGTLPKMRTKGSNSEDAAAE